MGFKCTTSDPGVYIKYIGKDKIIFVVYVYNTLFMDSNLKLIESHMKNFTDRWESRILGDATEYLGMHITRDRKKQILRLDQCAYAEKVIQQFQLENCKHAHTPLPSGYNPSPNQAKGDPKRRSQLVF
jgi:hypothetical protein